MYIFRCMLSFPCFLQVVFGFSVCNFRCILSFYPTALKGYRGIVFSHGVWMGGRAG